MEIKIKEEVINKAKDKITKEIAESVFDYIEEFTEVDINTLCELAIAYSEGRCSIQPIEGAGGGSGDVKWLEYCKKTTPVEPVKTKVGYYKDNDLDRYVVDEIMHCPNCGQIIDRKRG